MISHHHRCVFVHIPKCGGQSVETVFLDDLRLTWRQRAPLLLRQRVDDEQAPPRLAHLTAADYVRGQYLTQEMFDGYYTFSVVRNPLDRALSIYRYRKLEERMTFHGFVSEYLPEVLASSDHPAFWFMRPQADFLLGHDGSVIVDRIFRLERVDQELTPVLRDLGLGIENLPHVNRSTTRRGPSARSERRDAPASASSVAELQRLYARDYELLGYQ